MGYFGVQIIYVLTSSGLSVDEVVGVLEIQSALWVFVFKICSGITERLRPFIESGIDNGCRSSSHSGE